MKPYLQLKMGQQLTMTPQLQQAIRLLQLSSLDLQQEIQNILESNPMLEAEEATAEDANNSKNEDQPLGEQPPDFSSKPPEEPEPERDEWSSEIPSELPLDSRWDDIYPTSSQGFLNKELPAHDRSITPDSLQDHLEWQLNLTPMSDRDRLIGLTIIEAINLDGYLTSPLTDIFATLSQSLDDLQLEEVVVLQHRIQQFDPMGCGSESLSQCLLVQLEHLPLSAHLKDMIRQLISQHLELLASRDYKGIMKKMRIKEGGLKQALEIIQTLAPRPGDQIEQAAPEYITPDIIVRKHKQRWHIELNTETLPRLRINDGYAAMIQRADNSKDNTFLKNHLQEAKWFLKNLQNRNDTLLRVAHKIVEFQKDFFTEGEQAMKPLVLSDVAAAVDMHESTISRVTTQKYMHTPRGVFELKYFFSSHVQTTHGQGHSSTAIRALIKKMIAQENTRKPLSDSKLSSLLDEQGIKVARRTIAKYRESLNIRPSNERKRLA